ncbi:hypothetical protein Tco_0825056, partial [Tanacetum coccineum]
IEELNNRRVEEALAAHEETRAANALETENQSQNGSDGDNGNGGNGNGKNGNCGNGNPNENGRGDRPITRECTYQDFMKCQPLNFKGTEGVVGLIRWFEKIARIPFGDEVLIVQGDRDSKGEKSKLSIISCTKTQKYIERGCPIFLAQVTKKETECLLFRICFGVLVDLKMFSLGLKVVFGELVLNR